MGEMRMAIRGVGKAVPERVVPNEEIAERLGVDPEWIESRTGVRERRFASPDDSASTLGTAAAQEALAVAGLSGSDLDLIVVASCTPDYVFPPTSSLIQHAVGAGTAPAFDLNTACSSFVYGMATAAALGATGSASRVLLIGVDLLSRHINLDDRGTALLFGDGAGAVILEQDETAEPIRFELGSDGSGAENIIIPAGGSRTPTTPATLAEGLHFIRMAGREVYRRAVRTMADLGVSLGGEEFDLVVGHQANRRILEDAAVLLGIDLDRVYLNIERYGNTSAASVPIALQEAWESGKLRPGDRVLLLAFGSGYTWGGAVLRWTLAPPVGGRIPEKVAADKSLQEVTT
jgi:3-oxoacyl-[acyl-carrier-protein] synthase-3